MGLDAVGDTFLISNRGGVGATSGPARASNASSVVCLVCIPPLTQHGKCSFLSPLATDIGILIAIKSWPELGVHVRGAINNGLTEIEIREAILHATIYCGVPAGLEAMKVAQRTLDDMVEKGEHKAELAKVSPLFK